MTCVLKENAPRSWQSGGASKQSANNKRLPWRKRSFPAHETTLFLLAALLWPPAVMRFRELGVRSEDISNDTARLIAGALINGRSCAEPDVRTVLEHDDGEVISWGDAIVWADDILCHDPTNGSWAVQSVERFARENARYWFPAELVSIAEQMRSGTMSFEHGAWRIDRILGMARPCLLRELGGGGTS